MLMPLAALAGAATFGVLYWKLRGRCTPWIFIYAAVAAGLVTYALLKSLANW